MKKANTYLLSNNLIMSIFRIFIIIMEDDKKLASSLANKLFDFVEEVTIDESKFSMGAKSIIAREYAFINYYRPALADRMIESFDINIDRDCARLMWEEFLKMGKCNDGVIKKLFDNFKKLYSDISTEDDDYIEAFCDKAVYIAIFCEIDETKDKKWIIEMMSVVSDHVRAIFAKVLRRELSSLDTNKNDRLWDDWIRDYFSNRNRNIPIKLSTSEINEMMYWVFCFDKYFNEVVEYITQNDISFNIFIIHALWNEGRDLINKHPDSVGKYFYHLIKGVSALCAPYEKNLITKFSGKILNSVNDSIVRNLIVEELVRLGIKIADM
ncbi:DUF4020 domain-containing protein [Acetivibrio saccincola]|jgi:hypothetical protein|uniref:DUF4020 domain-containing protein n=1 Tax=Acetivibrio saccincola TaxID=1677857 RepID=A0A2K9DZA1_9FIRM|nr:DUF4020 domain-containing protein [Acetivibrio saccincola]AUG56847.1 hypothetical protein HVS_04550 [Acetivibrio saccincola]